MICQHFTRQPITVVSDEFTDRYIDIEKRERHASAKKKKLRPIQ